MQSVAVAVTRCLRLAPLGHAASSCWLRATYGAQALPGHRLLFVLVSPLVSSFSVVYCSLDVRAVYTAVYDRYSFQSATFLLLVPGLPTTCCCECSRHPWGMCLFQLRLEHSLMFPASLCFGVCLNSHSHNLETVLVAHVGSIILDIGRTHFQ